VTEIVAYHHLSLTVTDRKRSTRWYCDCLGFTVQDDTIEGKWFQRTRLQHGNDEGGKIILTLTQHDDGSGDRFSAIRTGLDHVSLQVRSRGDLDDLVRHLDERGVPHSELKPMGDGNAMITVRDPDNIQLELYAVG
jgi:catechol 2,3-dioxygenase-like lactoylglutathione lyase family enzyme